MLKQVIETILGFQGFFDNDSIVEATGNDRKEVKWRLDRLEREKLITRIRTNGTKPQGGSNPGRPTKDIIYTAKKNALKKRLAKMTAKQKRDTAWDKMWRTIRIIRKFTRGDLVQLTGAADQNVKDFTGLLIRDGYIKQVSLEGKRPETLMLCKDPGPQRPRISIKAKGMRHESRVKE